MIGASLMAGMLMSGLSSRADETPTHNWPQLEKKLQLIERLYAPMRARGENPGIDESLAAAKAAKTAGDYGESLRLSNEILRMLTTSYGARRHKPSLKLLEKRYRKRLTEVDSLRGAFLSISREKGIDPGTVCDEPSYQRMLNEATQRAAKQDYQNATILVDAMYNTMSVAVTSLRNHETLEYKLVFNSPKEEYEYELNRYRTLTLLLRMKQKEVSLNPAREAAMRRHVAEAESLWNDAKSQAGDGHHDIAVKHLESAIARLGDALGILGMYMPK
ncbi:MAG TPA: hypothetical protein ENK26_04015 [Gammaproteobacteria bacterium]|nr:hypothetical protein [Gammaproteobacteria bacterium]